LKRGKENINIFYTIILGAVKAERNERPPFLILLLLKLKLVITLVDCIPHPRVISQVTSMPTVNITPRELKFNAGQSCKTKWKEIRLLLILRNTAWAPNLREYCSLGVQSSQILKTYLFLKYIHIIFFVEPIFQRDPKERPCHYAEFNILQTKSFET
jgi:hypothetical protein